MHCLAFTGLLAVTWLPRNFVCVCDINAWICTFRNSKISNNVFLNIGLSNAIIKIIILFIFKQSPPCDPEIPYNF